VCFLALCLNLFLQPYRVKADNQFAGIVLFQLFLSLFLGFLREHVRSAIPQLTITALVLGSNGIVICLAGYFIGAGGIKAGMQQKLKLEVDRSKMVNRLVKMKWNDTYKTIVVLRAALRISQQFRIIEVATQLQSSLTSRRGAPEERSLTLPEIAARRERAAEVTLTLIEIAERRKRMAGIIALERRAMNAKSTREAEDIKNIKIPEAPQKVTLLFRLKKLLGLKKEREHGDHDEAAAMGADGSDPRMRAAVAGGAVAAVAVVGAAAVVASGHGPVSFDDIHGAFDDDGNDGDDGDDGDDDGGFEMDGDGGDFDHGGHDMF